MADVPDAAALAAWAEIASPSADKLVLLGEALDPAVEAVFDRTGTLPAETVIPSRVRLAILIQAARNYKRRTSPEGVAGFGDLGVVRISTLDVDVEQLISRYLVLNGFA